MQRLRIPCGVEFYTTRAPRIRDLDVRYLLNAPRLSEYIMKRQRSWWGHVIRHDPTRIARHTFTLGDTPVQHAKLSKSSNALYSTYVHRQIHLHGLSVQDAARRA